MICVHPNVDIAPVPCIDGDGRDPNNPYEIKKGYLSAMIVNGWTRSRVMVASVYMDGNYIRKNKDALIDVGVKNRVTLFLLGAIAAQLALPFIIMGDWNMEPKFLAQTG